jgi:hypothetical protein
MDMHAKSIPSLPGMVDRRSFPDPSHNHVNIGRTWLLYSSSPITRPRRDESGLVEEEVVVEEGVGEETVVVVAVVVVVVVVVVVGVTADIEAAIFRIYRIDHFYGG